MRWEFHKSCQPVCKMKLNASNVKFWKPHKNLASGIKACKLYKWLKNVLSSKMCSNLKNKYSQWHFQTRKSCGINKKVLVDYKFSFKNHYSWKMHNTCFYERRTFHNDHPRQNGGVEKGWSARVHIYEISLKCEINFAIPHHA